MNIGIVTIWCNRGQATVSRHLRSALDTLGHETYVLARPTRAPAGHDPLLSRAGVWDQPRITETQAYHITQREYLAWAESNELDVIWFDQNYQFELISQLRHRGIATIGRFVWEQFSADHLAEAADAFSVIYSMTRCEQQRYEAWGVSSPLIRYGCHPELLALPTTKPPSETTRFFFPAAGQRKLTALTLNAFRRYAPPSARLLVKAHGIRRGWSSDLTDKDPRIELRDDDLDFRGYHELMASCDFCLAPSRWEGLGLHLYEALAHGLPTISIDFAPVNETIVHNRSGILVPPIKDGYTKSGLPAWSCTERDLGVAIQQASDPQMHRRLTRGALARRDELSWDNTIQDVGLVLDALAHA